MEEKGERRTFEGDIFAELKAALSGHTPARLPGLPPFTAGAVGFFSYDVVRQIERLPSLAADELGVPDACLMFFDQVLAFDHVKKEIHLIVTADLTPPQSRVHRRLARRAPPTPARIKRLNRLEKRLARSLPKPQEEARTRQAATQPAHAQGHLPQVRPPRQGIHRLRRRLPVRALPALRLHPGVDAFDVYRALRIVNPSPYMYFLRYTLPTEAPTPTCRPSLRGRHPERRTQSGAEGPRGILRFHSPLPHSPHEAGQEGERSTKASTRSDPPSAKLNHIVGSSPELLVRVHGRTVEYRPIAGTRPRSADEVEDRALEADLRADEKEVAEHIMLVDLGRNDVGRVSEYGTVKVKDLMFVERYSHVMHLVSSLEGTLKPELAADRRLPRLLPRRHALRRAQDPRHGDHRGARTRPPRRLRRQRSSTPTSAGI